MKESLSNTSTTCSVGGQIGNIKFICLHNDATSINLFVYQLLHIRLMSSGQLHTRSDTKDRNTDAWHEGLARPSSASELFLMSLPGPSPPAFSLCTSRTGKLAGIEFALAWGTIPDRAHPLRHSLYLNSIFTLSKWRHYQKTVTFRKMKIVWQVGQGKLLKLIFAGDLKTYHFGGRLFYQTEC